MKLIQTVTLWPIKFYRAAISPLIGPRCRYYPTCSSYTTEAITKHGVLKGLALGILRFCACHPYSKRNFNDPVPEAIAWRDLIGYKSRKP